jgi:hypothetical protein
MGTAKIPLPQGLVFVLKLRCLFSLEESRFFYAVFHGQPSAYMNLGLLLVDFRVLLLDVVHVPAARLPDYLFSRNVRSHPAVALYKWSR